MQAAENWNVFLRGLDSLSLPETLQNMRLSQIEILHLIINIHDWNIHSSLRESASKHSILILGSFGPSSVFRLNIHHIVLLWEPLAHEHLRL